MPEKGDAVAECTDRRTIGRDGVVREETRDDLPQPLPGFGNGPMHALSQFLLDSLEPCPHAVPPRRPLDEETASPRSAADEHKPQELEGLRLAKAAFLSPHSGRTRVDGSCPDGATVRTPATSRASRPRSVERHSHVRTQRLDR